MKVAVVGASGIVGRALLEHLTEIGVASIGISRRAPADLPEATFLSLDLTDKAACEQCADQSLSDVTHLVYAALYEMPGLIEGWQAEAQMNTNLSMLRNLLEPMEKHSSLRHITLLQGTKAYGAHVAPMKIPGVESDPRHPHKNFYWLQQDYVEAKCAEHDWHYTIWRPQIIFGHALHAPMNMLAAIGVFAAIAQSKKEPLRYPGGPSAVTEAIDADLLAQAISFGLDNSDFANQVFNITNGDVFRWQDLWPSLANTFNLEIGEPRKMRLSETLYLQETRWQKIVESNGLRPYTIRELVGDSFYYADALFNTRGTKPPPPALLSTIKLRQAGFSACLNTTDMFDQWVRKLQALKVLPSG